MFLINYLKGVNLFDSTSKYHTEFEYNSLNASSPVTIKGNNISDANHKKTKISSITNNVKLFLSNN